MTDEELLAARREMQNFVLSPAGKPLRSFENRLGRAWVTDSSSNSDRAMRRDWDAADSARKECIAAIKALHTLIADLSSALTDEVPDWNPHGLDSLRRRVANALPPDICPDWLVEYRDPPMTGGAP